MSNMATDHAQCPKGPFYSNEYLDWLLKEFEIDEESEPFQGVRYW